MAHHEPAPIDPRELQRAQAMWHDFMQLLKYSGVAIAAVLIVLAAAFVDW